MVNNSLAANFVCDYVVISSCKTHEMHVTCSSMQVTCSCI